MDLALNNLQRLICYKTKQTMNVFWQHPPPISRSHSHMDQSKSQFLLFPIFHLIVTSLLNLDITFQTKQFCANNFSPLPVLWLLLSGQFSFQLTGGQIFNSLFDFNASHSPFAYSHPSPIPGQHTHTYTYFQGYWVDLMCVRMYLSS